MSGNYIPLYRKYRPQTLEDLVGQEHIKKTLTSAIELGKISHAYLFTGPRGTGKTSTARILAKSLNCKNGPTVTPCGECESCKNIINSVPIDVIEIDAASNRSIDDARNIIEKIQYVPVNGKYKIYIIDEVHMLTPQAFNALLKTLEEPPENVIFILATTEVHKVLDTIKSRCQRYDFRRITTDDIIKHLQVVSEKEKINITPDALAAIAKNSAGGMRDSLSLLDQLSILGMSQQITLDDVNAILGRISFDILYDFAGKIISSKPYEALEIINNIYNNGNEPLQILTNLSEYFKNLLIVKNCTKELLTELTGLNEPQIQALDTQKDLLETHQIVFLIEKISYYIKEVKFATNQHLWLEVSIIDLANMTENSKLLELQNRINLLENGQPVVKNTVSYQAPVSTPPPAVAKNEVQENNKNTGIKTVTNTKPEDEFTPPPLSKKVDTNDISSKWQTLLQNIKHAPTLAALKLAIPIKIEADEIVIAFKNDNLVARIDDTKKQLIRSAGDILFNQKDTKLTVKLAQQADLNSVIQKPTITKVSEEKKTEKFVTEHSEKTLPTTAVTKIIAPIEQTITEQPNKKSVQTDQTKMILDLFDGKLIN